VGFDNTLDSWNPELWAAETLAILEEKMVIGNMVHRDFSNELKSMGNVVHTRRPNEFTAKRKGANDDVTVQAAVATDVPVTLNQCIHTSFLIKDQEEAYSLTDLIRVYLGPAALSIGQKIDKILMGQVYQFMGNAVGNLASMTGATAKRQLLELGQKMDENKAYEYPNRCLLYTSPSPRDATLSRMPSSA